MRELAAASAISESCADPFLALNVALDIRLTLRRYAERYHVNERIRVHH